MTTRALNTPVVSRLFEWQLDEVLRGSSPGSSDKKIAKRLVSEMCALLRDGIWDTYFPKVYEDYPDDDEAGPMSEWVLTRLGLTGEDFGEFWRY
ncbi:MAG: hypothetical protein ACYCOU_04090 [Sulfobacillus sp.]